MSSERDALTRLAADLRAVLEDHRDLGVRHEVDGAPLPEAIHPVEPPPRVESVDAHASAWDALAQAGDARAEQGEVALRAVRADLGDCRRCGLCRDRRQIVFGVGDPDADLVICGEAPGYHEDQKGEPFVGPAGEMLDNMIVHVLGLRREQVYILNVVKCRPPKNRNPLPDEVAACMPFLEGQLRAIRPKLMLVLGGVALNALTGGRAPGITKARGRWAEIQGIPTMPTFHPAYLLRQPEGKRATFNDLKALKARYDELGGAR